MEFPKKMVFGSKEKKYVIEVNDYDWRYVICIMKGMDDALRQKKEE